MKHSYNHSPKCEEIIFVVNNIIVFSTRFTFHLMLLSVSTLNNEKPSLFCSLEGQDGRQLWRNKRSWKSSVCWTSSVWLHSVFENPVREICSIWNLRGILFCPTKKIFNSRVCQGVSQVVYIPKWATCIPCSGHLKEKSIIFGSAKWETNGEIVYYCKKCDSGVCVVPYLKLKLFVKHEVFHLTWFLFYGVL